MNKYDFITALAPNKDIEFTHWDTKSLLKINELIWLLGSGFTDCSYKDDEFPSFAISNNCHVKGLDPIVLMFHPLKDDGTWNWFPYSVGTYGLGDDWKQFKKLSRAIAYYQQLSFKQIFKQVENYDYK